MENTLRYLSFLPPGPCWWEGEEEPEHDWYQSRTVGIRPTYRCSQCGWHLGHDGTIIELPEKANKDWKPEERSMVTYIEYHSGEEFLCVVVRETYQEVENMIRKLPDYSYDAFIPLHTLKGQPFALKYERIDSFSGMREEDIAEESEQVE